MSMCKRTWVSASTHVCVVCVHTCVLVLTHSRLLARLHVCDDAGSLACLSCSVRLEERLVASGVIEGRRTYHEEQGQSAQRLQDDEACPDGDELEGQPSSAEQLPGIPPPYFPSQL